MLNFKHFNLNVFLIGIFTTFSIKYLHININLTFNLTNQI
jgi:hypothetical protein